MKTKLLYYLLALAVAAGTMFAACSKDRDETERDTSKRIAEITMSYEVNYGPTGSYAKGVRYDTVKFVYNTNKELAEIIILYMTVYEEYESWNNRSENKYVFTTSYQLSTADTTVRTVDRYPFDYHYTNKTCQFWYDKKGYLVKFFDEYPYSETMGLYWKDGKIVSVTHSDYNTSLVERNVNYDQRGNLQLGAPIQLEYDINKENIGKYFPIEFLLLDGSRNDDNMEALGLLTSTSLPKRASNSYTSESLSVDFHDKVGNKQLVQVHTTDSRGKQETHDLIVVWDE